MQRFTAACAQFAITPMDTTANVAKSVAWTRRARDESGAQLIVLPETITTGFVPGIGPRSCGISWMRCPAGFRSRCRRSRRSWASTWCWAPTSAGRSGVSSTTRPR